MSTFKLSSFAKKKVFYFYGGTVVPSPKLCALWVYPSEQLTILHVNTSIYDATGLEVNYSAQIYKSLTFLQTNCIYRRYRLIILEGRFQTQWRKKRRDYDGQ